MRERKCHPLSQQVVGEQRIGARDLPFPLLSAYAFWAYAIGGLAFFATLFFGASPDGGWFMYPPLSGAEYSPGIGADFWLLGIGFIEISAIAGAIELIVGILLTRAPGMTLGRMPIYAWSIPAGWNEPHHFDVAVARVTADGAVTTHGERMPFWPFRHETLRGDLRAAGLELATTTYSDEAPRYLVTARRAA